MIIHAAGMGWHYMSKATCLIRPHVFYVFCCCCVEDRQDLLHDSPRSKKTWVRQVVLDKWFPLTVDYHHYNRDHGFEVSSVDLKCSKAPDAVHRCFMQPVDYHHYNCDHGFEVNQV